MKRIKSLFALLFIVSSSVFSQSKKDSDKQAIKDMCGCFSVTFKYTETFAPEVDYEKAYDYNAEALEWAQVIEEDDNTISIQHLLVLHDTMVIKHWRQDWLYENQDLFVYDKDNHWKYKKLDEASVKGQWTQKVYQVDDSPRYSGSATWIHNDGKHYWENTSDSPLPRREFSKRSDYNLFRRGNRHEITSTGWIHEQDNDKIIRQTGKEDVLLVQEKGYNVYTKVDNSLCKAATTWWKNNKDFWANTRAEWNKIFERRTDITLKKEVDNLPLSRYLIPSVLKQKSVNAKTVINKFIDEKSLD